jgi:hypothetical protein
LFKTLVCLSRNGKSRGLKTTDKGVVYIFKPNSPQNIHTIVLEGLDAARMYRLTFEDGFNPMVGKIGADLMGSGINVTFYGNHVSELMFIEVPEPGSLMLLLTAGLFLGGVIRKRRRSL